MTAEGLRAALYIRVSTEDQAEYSPSAQKKLLAEYAQKNGMAVAVVFADEGFSGRNADSRPAFMRMIAEAKTKPRPFDVILVHKFDRFARNRQDSIVYKSMLQKEYGVRVVSITESVEDSSMAVILEAMLEAMAEYYSINLSKEVKKGMTEKAGRGGYQTAPPLGYRMTEHGLVVAEDEARHVRAIFEEFARGRSAFTIAKQLNRMGVTSKRGNPMDARGVAYILQNPVYIGMVHWTPTGKARRGFQHPDTIHARGGHTPIVSEELFQEAAAKLARRKPNARPASECRHWLSGLVKCSACGRSLSLSASVKSPSFQCSGYAHGVCGVSHGITARKLEQAVLAELEAALDGTAEFYPAAPSDTGEEERLRAELQALGSRLLRAKEAYLAQIDSLDEYRRGKEELERKRRVLEEELRVVQARQAPTGGSLRKAVEILTRNGNSDVKRSVVRSVVERIVYDKANQNLEVYYYDV